MGTTHSKFAATIASGSVAAVLIAAVLGRKRIRKQLRELRNDHSQRPTLWNRFYAVDWGETATNNYGFAPAAGDHPQRFQHQMYRELLTRLDLPADASKPKLLEVSCGRGGGLNALLAAAPGKFDATGLDVAASAVDFCRRTHGERDDLRFVEGNALALPFADNSFDILLNVEASNDYGDRAQFFREVARVLKPEGTFLYTDTFRPGRADEMKREIAAAGFRAEFDDITANVAEACRLDSPRRRDVIRRHAPLLGRMFFRRQLDNYAAVEGTKKYRAFAEGRREYLMTAATKA